jgi:WS/DGAT/MGAT family acyltransferase
MTPSLPRQLTDGDAVFLSMETPEMGGHVGALMVLDPSTTDDFSFERFEQHIAERMTLVPRFTWKLESVPFDLDRPYWVEADDFDVRQHVIRSAVPSPGTMKEVTALIGRLHAQPLDRSRPLWEVWCIEGLEGGKVALYAKTHHCLVDGTGGSGLGAVLADLSPNADGPTLCPDAYLEDAPAKPSAFQVWTQAARNGASRPRRLADHLGRAARHLWSDYRDASDEPGVGNAERLSFNGSVGRRRDFAVTSIELHRVLDLKKNFDVKLNDVVLEVVGSAMRRWLRDRGETPSKPLVALCPVSIRSPDEGGMGNDITTMAVSLPTDVSDPAERLRLIHASSLKAKQTVSAGGIDWVAIMGESFAPAATQLLVRAANLAGDSAPLPGNFVVSNVRTTPVPLFIAGARIDSMMPVSMLAVSQGLNVTVVSYCDRIDVGILVDRDLVSDAQDLADRFPVALDELEAAAEGVIHEAR